ncbi:hypothetical protein E3O53_11775 [Cryobacterium sp. TMT2-18-3]|uniref:hypothetical protein n=1 Tax=unclassified Cryobacterium TaxID=2649013 RepID=UPI00106C2332|nr:MULTISPECIES: hypothetical protein [unclassified Cryobacterium]TFC31967.1 hypothetical protein E3O22_00715 [Cryobacterium sp. TMT2-18-2]TFC62879.1 hypothetical protein E3O53_11775 [Cryobacterium sp. TMT2-18-3]
MTAIWVSVCLVAAVAASGLGAACALAGLRMPGRTLVAAPAMVVMTVSCADMVLPGVQLLGSLAWAGLLVGVALLALLDRRHRMPAAHHAVSLLLMSVMWVAMLPAASTEASVGSVGTVAVAGAGAGTSAPASATAAAAPAAAAPAATGPAATGPAVGNGAHAGHGRAITDGGMLPAGLVVLLAAASVALAASAVRSTRRPAGSGIEPATLRLESAQHLSMALAMTLMAAGMFLTLTGY